MNAQAEDGTKPKVKRGPKKLGLSQILQKSVASATELAQNAERASQMLRQDAHRDKKRGERLRIILQTYTGVMDILKRVNLEPADREFLIEEGYVRDRKDRYR